MKIGIIAAALAFVGLSAVAQTNQKTNMDMKKLELVQEWDKTFPKSDKVEHSKGSAILKPGFHPVGVRVVAAGKQFVHRELLSILR